MSIRDEIENTLSLWALGYDERDVPMMESAFAKDATMILDIGPERLGPFVGRDEVIKHMTDHHEIQTDQRRHVVSNIVVDVKSEDEAAVVSYLTLLVTDENVLRLQAAGVYRDRFVKQADGWRIAERHLSLDVHY